MFLLLKLHLFGLLDKGSLLTQDESIKVCRDFLVRSWSLSDDEVEEDDAGDKHD